MLEDMTLGKKIEALSDSRGWNQSELARRARVSKTTVHNWWNDKRSPMDEGLPRLARALGVSLDYLADESDDRRPEQLEAERDARKVIARIGWEAAYARLVGADSPAKPAAPPVRPGDPVPYEISDPRPKRRKGAG